MLGRLEKELGARLAQIRERIAAACERAGRGPGDVRLIAVTKTWPPEAVAAAFLAGVTDLGENYLSELEEKRGSAPEATWHYVGRVQSNKAARIGSLAHFVHTLEPGRAVGRLARVGRERGTPIRGLVEVDFTGHRVGVPPERANAFVDELGSAEGIEVVGLMTVAPQPSSEPPRSWFSKLRLLRDEISAAHPDVRELSMGMSADLDEAIEEGATMVRVGSAIFGPRR